MGFYRKCSKFRRSIPLRKITSSEGDQPLARAFRAIMDTMEADDILQIAEKCNWKYVFVHQGYFFRKIPTINVSFVPKNAQLEGWSRKFRPKYKDVPTKILKHHARTNSS